MLSIHVTITNLLQIAPKQFFPFNTSIETREEQRLFSQTHSTEMVQVVAKKKKEKSFPWTIPTLLQHKFELNLDVNDQTSSSALHKNMLRSLRKIPVSTVSLQQ